MQTFLSKCSFAASLLGAILLTPNAASAQVGRYTADVPLTTVEVDCVNNVQEACLVAFLRYHQGTGVPANPVKAEFYMKRSCLTGSGIACAAYATILENKPASKTTAGRAEVVKYADMACKLGEQDSCKQSARLKAPAAPAVASKAAPKAVAAAPTPKPAAPKPAASKPAAPSAVKGLTMAQLETNCAGSQKDSCVEAMMRYNSGVGVAKDPTKRDFYLRRSCETKHGPSCTTYGYEMSTKPGGTEFKTKRVVADYAWQGCIAGDANGCKLGVQYVTDKSLPINDRNKEYDILFGACNADYVYGCSSGAYWAQTDQDYRLAAKASDRACVLGDKSYCGKSREFVPLIQKQDMRAEGVEYARKTGDYAGAVAYFMANDRDRVTIAKILRIAGPTGIQKLDDWDIEVLDSWQWLMIDPQVDTMLHNENMRRQRVARRKASDAEAERQRQARAQPASEYIGTAGTGRTDYKPPSRSGTTTCRVWTGVYAATVCTPD